MLENLTEQELLEIDKRERLPNCSMTTYTSGDSSMDLVKFADTEAVDRSAAAATAEPSKAERTGHAG